MSKIGKTPIKIPEGVSFQENKDEGELRVKGPKGEIVIPVLKGVKAEESDGEIVFSITSDKKQIRSNWGTLRSLVQNAIQGVTEGFEKTLVLEGVGFRIGGDVKKLELALGFSHPVKIEAPDGIEFEIGKNSTLKVRGIERQLVGQTAAEIRALKKPEPYKGKGFRYEGEVIRRKAGKKAAGSGE